MERERGGRVPLYHWGGGGGGGGMGGGGGGFWFWLVGGTQTCTAKRAAPCGAVRNKPLQIVTLFFFFSFRGLLPPCVLFFFYF